MNRQIRECKIDVKVDNGTSVTSLSGFPVNVKLSSGSCNWVPYFFTGQAYDQALSGRLHSQMGGFRFQATLSWDRMLSSDNTNVFNVLNKSFLTNSSEIRIYLYPDKDNAEYQDVVLEASNWEARIDSTIVNNPVVVTLTGRDIKTAIPDYYKTP
jgi:hypothetical protein